MSCQFCDRILHEMFYKNYLKRSDFSQEANQNSKPELGFVNQQVQNEKDQTLFQQDSEFNPNDYFVDGDKIECSDVEKNDPNEHSPDLGSSFIDDTNEVKEFKKGLLVYTASELLANFNGKETDFLWDNLVPRVGTGLLVGQPDLGKSQLAKELAIMIAKGSSDYLGLKLKPIHNHVLYVFTEDQEEGVSSSLYKQLAKHSDLDQSKLSLAFLRDETITELIHKVDAFCVKTPVDLVIIDAFGDIFSGSDSNNNIQMRRDIKSFDELVRKHSISVLFVHHVNKAGYNKTPSQELIQGGSGLTQKVRFALFLSRNENGQKFLNVAKGNYSSKYYKENRLPIDFDEDTLTFDVIGDWEHINNATKKQKPELNDDDLFMIFKNNGLQFNQVCVKIIQFLKVSQSTAERKIGKLLTSGKITKLDHLYYRTVYIESVTPNPQLLGKNEGEGDILSLDTEVDQNISTFNPQTLVNFEGEGKDYENQVIDEINTPTITGSISEVGNQEIPTLNPHDFLRNEGEGKNENNNDWFDSFLKTDNDPDDIQKEPDIVDPYMEKIYAAIAKTRYSENIEFSAIMEDFYINGLQNFGSVEVSLDDLLDCLQDQYGVDFNQASIMLRIMRELNFVEVDVNRMVNFQRNFNFGGSF